MYSMLSLMVHKTFELFICASQIKLDFADAKSEMPSFEYKNYSVPVHRHGCQTVNGGCHCTNGNEIVERTISLAEDPIPIPHVDVIENTVEYCH